MKTCTKCKETKPLEAFSPNTRGRCSRCKACRRGVVKAYWEALSPQAREAQRVRRRAWSRANREYTRAYHASRRRFIRAIKETCGCVDCGYREDTTRLHFDHRDGTVKLFKPSLGAFGAWPRLVAEIEKCDVRCAHCHRKRHIALQRQGAAKGGLSGS